MRMRRMEGRVVERRMSSWKGLRMTRMSLEEVMRKVGMGEGREEEGSSRQR